MQEIWRDIKGYEGMYQVSNIGNVRSLDRFRYNGMSDKCKVKGQILTPFKLAPHQGKHGHYWQVTLCNNGIHKKHTVHKLVAEAFIPNPNNYPCINHKDGNKTNNYVDNLEWCTFADNNQHAYDTGLKKARVLTSEEAKKMRAKADMSYHFRKVIDLTTGKRYESIKATKEDGFRPNNVARVCAGNAKSHHGHLFAYDD